MVIGTSVFFRILELVEKSSLFTSLQGTKIYELPEKGMGLGILTTVILLDPGSLGCGDDTFSPVKRFLGETYNFMPHC